MAHLNLFNAPGYQHTFTTPSGYDLEPIAKSARAVTDRDSAGFRAHAYGKYWPGGNPVFQGPLRATLVEAEHDSRNPRGIIWRCIGYSCG